MRKIFQIFASLCIVFASPCLLSQPANQPIIIIGAGVSGLAAASYLKEHGIPVLVLEARNRIGGRVVTENFQGYGLDMGASWIHGIENNPIYDLAKAHQLKTIQTHYADTTPYSQFDSYLLYDSNGKIVSEKDMQENIKLAEEFSDQIENDSPLIDTLSIEDAYTIYAQKKGFQSQEDKLLHYIINSVYLYEFAHDLSKLSANIESVYEHSRVSGINKIFPQGYSQIIPYLSKDIPIHLNQTVQKIEYGKNGVDVYTQNNHYHSNYVIVTVPLGVLKAGAINFVPALPTDKQEAINKLDMGVYNKVHLIFETVFWDKNSEWIASLPENDDLTRTVEIMNLYKYYGLPVLTVFTGGSHAIEVEKWDDKKTVDYMMQHLRKIYGNNIPKPSSYYITRWNSDPFSYGSYSYLPAGVNAEYYRSFMRPVSHKLFFAGEATSMTDPATTHGAYNTGIRAAKQVIATMK